LKIFAAITRWTVPQLTSRPSILLIASCHCKCSTITVRVVRLLPYNQPTMQNFHEMSSIFTWKKFTGLKRGFQNAGFLTKNALKFTYMRLAFTKEFRGRLYPLHPQGRGGEGPLAVQTWQCHCRSLWDGRETGVWRNWVSGVDRCAKNLFFIS
jgi:hypothetical protein